MRPDKASLCLLCVVSSRHIAHHLETHAKLLLSWYSSHGHTGMQSNEVHHRLKRDVQPGLHRVFESFLKALLLRPFPRRLTKLVPLKAACTCIVISPADGISTLLSLLVFCFWNAHHGHSRHEDDCCNTNLCTTANETLLWNFRVRCYKFQYCCCGGP